MPEAIMSLSSPDAEAIRTISWFWDSFARSAPSSYALQSPTHWLDYFMDWHSAMPSLRNALLAVAVARLSTTTGQPEMLKEGRALYTKSLALTRQALTDSQLVRHNDTLATTCVLVMYELFDSTSGENLDSWLRHLSGLAGLLQHRGPEMHDGPAARAILEHSRYLLMIQHLISRKACVFSQDAWLERPWQCAEKSVEQRIFDYGLRLTAVFEETDLATLESVESQTLIELFYKAVSIYHSVRDLYQEHIAEATSADRVIGPSLTTSFQRRSSPVAPLLLTVTALGIQLGASISACEAFDQLKNHYPEFRVASEVEQEARILDENRESLAHEIVKFVQIGQNNRMGAVGAARMVFSLRLASAQFDSASDQYHTSQALIFQLMGRKNRFGAFFDRNDPSTALLGRDHLQQGNAAAIATKWQRLADAQS